MNDLYTAKSSDLDVGSGENAQTTAKANVQKT